MTPSLPFIAARKDKRPPQDQVVEMVDHYLAAALWTDEPTGDWSDAAINLASFECIAFLHLARHNTQGWTMEQLGHNFWLTRNGHGTGFWDRDTGTAESRKALTDLSLVFGQADAYTGDDGLLYFQ